MPALTETALALARKAGDHLSARGIENGRLEAELLLASVLGVKRLDLYLQHDRPVTPDELAAYRAYVRRRLQREPLQYITGEAAFRKLVLRVDRRALIPRPETEVLAGEVLAWARRRTPPVSALDIGTGTGAIALSLALEGGLSPVVATDVSVRALELAEENVRRAAAQGRVELRQGALFDPVQAGEGFDVVVSNPPYVAEAERAALAPEVRDHEPEQALFAGERGLAVIEKLIAGAPAVLRAGGLLALEVGLGQAEVVVTQLRADGRYGPARIVNDLAGRPRVVLAEHGVVTPTNDSDGI
jgi:release factor glutamine methyltransferase